MRVITGKYKGRRFDVPRSFKARPTTDFAKENLFNVLRAYVDFEETAVLDLFGGTGSISLEFLSRGCAPVVCVEKDHAHASFLHNLFRSLNDNNLRLIQGDALRFVERGVQPFDLVFADPPYQLRELPELPERVLHSGCLRDGGLFVLEHGKNHSFELHPAFLEHREYGSVNFSFFRKSSE